MTSTTRTVRNHLDLRELVETYLEFDAFAFDVETNSGRKIRMLPGERANAAIERDWRLQAYRQNHKDLDHPNVICPCCSRLFPPIYGREFCSERCRKAANKDRPPLDPKWNQVWSISLAGPGRSDVIPCGHPTGPRQLMRAEVFEALEPLFFSPARKIGHNVSFDLLSIAKYYGGKIPPPPYGDTQVLYFLLNENLPSHSLGALAKEYLKYTYVEKLGAKAYHASFQEAMRYSILDAKITWMLWSRVQGAGWSFWDRFEQEMKVMAILMDMRTVGAYVDLNEWALLNLSLNNQHDATRREIQAMAGGKESLNLNSPDKLAKWLYEDLGLPILNRTETGKPSTDAQTLKDLLRRTIDAKAREAVKAICRYKDLDKMLGTYITGFFPHIDDRDHRIRASFNLAVAKTGRLSCVAADSLIEMPRDLTQYPDGIPITEVRPGDWVYAYDWERQLVLKRVTWVGQTGVKSTMMVTAENSEGDKLSLRLTTDHLIRLYNGDWRPTGSLGHRWGDPHRADSPRIMPMVRRMVDDGYIKFFPNSIAKGNGSGGGGKSREHRWIVEQITGKKISTKTDVHHHDGNRANNHPGNLEALTIAEHRGRRGDVHPGWGGDIEWMGFYQGPRDYRVTSVSPGPIEPVWDMEVEDVHNFIANGICVHNCSQPNLQNIPTRDKDTFEANMVRKMFKAPPGRVLIVADYSQIELRILAHYTRDPLLLRAYQEDIDLHALSASRIYHAPIDKVTKDQRFIGKTANFALAFEGGAGRLMEIADISEDEARRVYRAWHNTYPGVRRWGDRTKEKCRERGYVRSLYGRKRRLPGINFRDDKLRSYAERQAVNHPIQGTAAEIAKIALIQVSDVIQPYDAHLVLQVHDEFVIECAENVATELVPLILIAMEDVRFNDEPVLNVPLVVDINVGSNWADAK
jgi:DNA polymerase I-like protein with 3'-5' exonuclease and polymerase domains